MFCGNCGKRIDDGGGYSFCPHCGLAFVQDGLNQLVPQPGTQDAAQHPCRSPLPVPLQGAMVMRPGELLVSIMKTTSLGDPKRKGSDEDDDMSTSGLLIITSQRLALAVLVGLLSKRWSVHQTIELSTVRGTEVKRGFRKNYLCVYHMNYGATYTDAYKDFYDIDPATLKGGSPLQLDFAQQMIDQALAHGRLGRR